MSSQSQAGQSKAAPAVPTKEDVNQVLYDASYMGNLGVVCNLLDSPPSTRFDVNDQHCGQTALHAACAEGHQEIAEMLVLHGADMWVLSKDTHLFPTGHTPVDSAWISGHRGLVQHLIGLQNASAPPSKILDNLIGNDDAAQIIQMLIQKFGKALRTDPSPGGDGLIEEIWQKISAGDQLRIAGRLALVIRNRAKGLTMGTTGFVRALSQRAISAENNLALFVLLLTQSCVQSDYFNFERSTEYPGVVAQYLHGIEENDMALIQEPHCAFAGYEVRDWESTENPPQGSKKYRSAPFLFLSIPFLRQSSAVFSDEIPPTWHTLDKSTIYVWNQQGIGSTLRDSSGFMGLHAYCSLDEYCLPHLNQETLARRNADQTLTRYHRSQVDETTEYSRQKTRNSTESTSDKNLTAHIPDNKTGRRQSRPLVTVPQAFIWVVDDLLIVALPVAPPRRFWELVQVFQQFDFLEVDLNEVIGLLLHAIIEAFEPGSRTNASLQGLSSDFDRDESIFKIFSRSIASVSDQVSKYLRDQNVDNITATREHHYIHQILDIREEISMMQHIIAQQEEVWRTFVSTAWPQFYKEGSQSLPVFEYNVDQDDKIASYSPGESDFDNHLLKLRKELFEAIGKPQRLFTSFKQRLQRLDDDAARVERSIELRLDLKQRHASLREARKATLMSAGVIGFTLITAIFTPLAFMVSLLALPIDRFQTSKIGSGDDAYYTTNYVGKWIACAEVVSLLVTLSVMGFAAIWISGTNIRTFALIRVIKECDIYTKIQDKLRAVVARNGETPLRANGTGTSTHVEEDARSAASFRNSSGQKEAVFPDLPQGERRV